MNKHTIQICEECESKFYKESSEMNSLCPECSSILYGYKNCEHHFQENRCIKCNWDGSTSEFTKKLKNKNS